MFNSWFIQKLKTYFSTPINKLHRFTLKHFEVNVFLWLRWTCAAIIEYRIHYPDQLLISTIKIPRWQLESACENENEIKGWTFKNMLIAIYMVSKRIRSYRGIYGHLIFDDGIIYSHTVKMDSWSIFMVTTNPTVYCQSIQIPSYYLETMYMN